MSALFYTDSVLREVESMVLAHMTIAEIAVHFNVSQTSMRNAIYHKLGGVYNLRKAHGVAPTFRKKSGYVNFTSPAVRTQLEKMAREQKSIQEIADYFGKSKRSIYGAFHRNTIGYRMLKAGY